MPVPLLTLFDLAFVLRVAEQRKSLKVGLEELACRECAIASWSEGLSIGMLKAMLWLM